MKTQITSILILYLLFLQLSCHANPESMLDSQGNEFFVGDMLKSAESHGGAGVITCADINDGVAKMYPQIYEISHDGFLYFTGADPFNIDQKSLSASKWVVYYGE